MRFRFRYVGWTGGLAALLISGAPAGEDPVALLQRIKSHMSEHLAQLPNYTCHETVNRFIRLGASFRHLDTLDLDVVFTGGRELFSRTGSDKFELQPVEKVVGSGTIGNSSLGSPIDLLLSQSDAEFKYAGIQKKDGRKSFRFNLTIPIEKSRFLVRHGGAEAMAGYQSSFWFDAETYEPVRAEFKVDRIPPHVGVSLIEESFHYKKLMIGNSEFYLPERSDLAATDRQGNYTLDLMQLDHCHEFTADSVLKYGQPAQGTADRETEHH